MKHQQGRASARERLEALQGSGIGASESFGIAIESLVANVLRTLLTALGVIIGVAAVVALLAIGRGTQQSITAAITANGANLLTVRSGAASQAGIRGTIGSAQTLTLADAAALADARRVPSAAQVSPETTNMAQLVAAGGNTTAQIIGAQPAYAVVHNATVVEGAFLDATDLASLSRVVVLGATLATTLFPDGDGLGQSIRIDGQRFRVIGILESKGGSSFGSTDDSAIVPLSTAQRTLFGARAAQGSAMLVGTIAVQAQDATLVGAALDEITVTLRERHRVPADGSADDFVVMNQQDLLASVQQTTQILTLFLSAIAAISLLVGGIGIMNIMLVSVRERTREIGLRKALGARERDIMVQFLFESLTISLTGAVLGLLLGAVIALSVSATGIVTAVLSLDAVGLAVGCAMTVGLFFGIAPALNAARLDPIEALRSD